MSGPNATNLPRPVMERFSKQRPHERETLAGDIEFVSTSNHRRIFRNGQTTNSNQCQPWLPSSNRLCRCDAGNHLLRRLQAHVDSYGYQRTRDRNRRDVRYGFTIAHLLAREGQDSIARIFSRGPWELLLAALLSFPVLIAARLRMPLQDTLFGRIDQSLGIYVPSIEAWANHHWLGTLLNRSYPWLLPLLAAAAFAPALMGKMKHAREFLLANFAAFAIGLPLFALLPAVGPWYCYHLAANPAQAACWAQLLALRVPGPYIFQEQAAGVVCFPSFHVVWAILCASALWGFRPIRIPVALLSLMIIVSTLTTGWHYFSDVLGGIAIAALSMAIARVYAA